jgi:hypothetical protein
MRRLLVFAGPAVYALATASTASARVVPRAHTDKRFGFITAGHGIRPKNASSRSRP